MARRPPWARRRLVAEQEGEARVALQGAPRQVSRPRLQLRRSKRTRSRARGSSRRPSTSVTLGEEARAPRAPAAATAAAATVPCSAAVAEAGPRRVPRPWPTPSAPWPPCLVARASQRATGAPAPSSSPACACGCRWSSSPREPRTSAARSQSSASSARWGERERGYFRGTLPEFGQFGKVGGARSLIFSLRRPSPSPLPSQDGKVTGSVQRAVAKITMAIQIVAGRVTTSFNFNGHVRRRLAVAASRGGVGLGTSSSPPPPLADGRGRRRRGHLYGLRDLQVRRQRVGHLPSQSASTWGGNVGSRCVPT